MFGGFFKNLFARRAKAWAGAVSAAAMTAVFKLLADKGLTVDAATQASVIAFVTGFVVHQIDNLEV